MSLDFEVHRFPEVGSTNELLRQLAAEGAGEGTVVVAGSQNSGRGRQGRRWESPQGGLWMSVLLRPFSASGIQLMGAVSLCRALESLGFVPEVRWPNDVVIGGKKLAGLLAETRLVGSAVEFVVLGVGVNVLNTEFSGEVSELATSLALLSPGPPTLERVESRFLQALKQDYQQFSEQGFEPFLPALEKRSELTGRRVLLTLAEGQQQAEVAGYDELGGLVLADGRVLHSVERVQPL